MIRLAKVININDEQRSGKIQISIFPELENLPNEDYPWAKPIQYPFRIEHAIPDVGSLVYVDINEDWTVFSYTREAPYLFANYSYDEIKNSLKDIDEIDDSEYPNPDYRLTQNGVIQFNDKETGDFGLLHPSGTYVLFKSTGELYIKNGDSFELKIGGATDSGVLFSPLKSILNKISSHTHPFTGVASGATSYTSFSSDLSDLDIDDIKSDTLKLD